MNKKTLGICLSVGVVIGFCAIRKAQSIERASGYMYGERARSLPMEQAIRKMYKGRSESFIQGMIAKQKRAQRDMLYRSPEEIRYIEQQATQKKRRLGGLKSKFSGFKSKLRF